MMGKKVTALWSLARFWAELAVFGWAEIWADFWSFQNFDRGFWLIHELDHFANFA